MRELSATPTSAFDPQSGALRLGSFRGGLPPLDWEAVAGPLGRLRHHKRWIYVGLATADVYVGLAVLRLGYAASAFVYAYDAAARRMLARHSWSELPTASRVGTQGGELCRASFRNDVARIDLEPTRRLRVATPELELDAVLDAIRAPPALGAIARVGEERFNATEKRALLEVRGTLRAGGRTVSLDGALAGYDFTSGLLPRRTRWQWGFALGRDASGSPFGFNLVQGFVGESECGLWRGGRSLELLPLGEGRFRFDRAHPEAPWNVSTADGAAQLTMTPGEVHAEKRNLLVVRSRFVQPCGAWSGSIALTGREPLVVGRALGVTEDQDVTW